MTTNKKSGLVTTSLFVPSGLILASWMLGIFQPVGDHSFDRRDEASEKRKRAVNSTIESDVTATVTRERGIALLKNIQGLPGCFDRQFPLAALLKKMDPDDFPALLEHFLHVEEKNTISTSPELEYFLNYWATVDPENALKCVRDDPVCSYPASMAVLDQWAARDLDKALEWLRENPIANASQPVMSLLTATYRRDPEEAWDMIRSHMTEDAWGNAVTKLVGNLEGASENERVAMAESLDPALQPYLVGAMALQLAETGQGEQVAWMNRFPGKGDSESLRQAYQNWSRKNFTAARDALESLEENDSAFPDALYGLVSAAQNKEEFVRSGAEILGAHSASDQHWDKWFATARHSGFEEIAISFIERLPDGERKWVTLAETLYWWQLFKSSEYAKWIEDNPLEPRVHEKLKAIELREDRSFITPPD